jgi:LuxR family maltose regulon positive regulatory protein
VSLIFPIYNGYKFHLFFFSGGIKMSVNQASLNLVQSHLLATRFFVPLSPIACVSRPRLMDRLEQGLQVPVTLVSAPPGFGKSTLLSDWIQSRVSLRAAWLSLETSDHDWGLFFRYLIAAWQHIFPHVGEAALAELNAFTSPNPVALTNMLLNDLLSGQAASGAEHILLVLDDYHHIESSVIHETVAYLIEHLPPYCHMVLLTRANPPFPIARWRSLRKIVEIREDDLRFNPDESTEYLNQTMRLHLSEEQIGTLQTRTEGWIVGLQMAALSLQGRKDPLQFVQAFGGSNRFVVDYLVEEVVRQQPEEIQHFLLTTAVLDQFSAPLCDALLDVTAPYSQKMLECLEKSNLFLIALDDHRQWFRYHHLFADLLRVRLQQTAPESIHAIYSNASQWYTQNEMWQEAILYALKLQDYERIEKLFAQALIVGGISFLYSGMRYLVSSIPPACLPGHPCLSMAKAVGMIEYGQMSGIKNLLKSAEVDLQSQLPFTGQDVILGMICLIQANAASIIGDEPWIISASQKVDRLLPKGSPVSVDALFQLGVAHYYTGNLNQTETCWEQALNLALELGYAHHILCSLDSLGRNSCHKGDLNRAEFYFQRGQSFLAHESGSYLRWSAAIQRDYADLLRERNRLDEAQAQMTACLPLLEKWDLTGGYGLGLLHMVRILAAQGDGSGAEKMLNQTEELCQSHTVFPDMHTLVHLFHVRLILASGDPQAAWHELDACQKSTYCQHELHQEWVLVARAMILICLDRPGEALQLLEGRRTIAREAGRGRNWLEMTLLKALALKAMGDDQKAFTKLEEGLNYACKEGFTRIFVDEGEAMQALLQQFLAKYPKTRFHDYIAELHKAFPGATDSGRSNLQKQAGLVEPLTERELEILHLVSQGLSNSEIAVRLVLSVGTVKTHIHNIYGKLDVRDRPQAIAKASLFGL